MRLIDADALIKELEPEVERVDDFVARTYVRAVINDIKKYPSAEKRGKWLAGDDETVSGECSVCGWEANYYETDVCGMPYCPNCGARMNEE